MPWTLKSRETVAEFDITGEDVMATRLGPDQNMLPYLARIEYVGGEFREITIFGWRISGRTGKPTKQYLFTQFDLEELTREFDPELPDLPPEWVKKLVTSATFGGMV
jgi:hypothetical protein